MHWITYMRIFHPGRFFGLLAVFLIILTFSLLPAVGSYGCEMTLFDEVPPTLPPDTAATLAACTYEDSENCFWDATTSGNREGRSFANVNGTVYYVD